jgi:hypothetical protein
MTTSLHSRLAILALVAATLLPFQPRAQEPVADAIQVVRSLYQADRQSFVTDALELSGDESAAFWPLYQAYRADIGKLGDELVKLVLEYADAYPDVAPDRARRLLKDYTALEKKLSGKRAWYFKRAGKLIPAAKALRWAQVESRLDLALRLQLAGAVPIVPTKQAKP